MDCGECDGGLRGVWRWTVGNVMVDCGECGGRLWGMWWWTAGSVVVDCSKCGVVPPPSHPMSSAVLCVCA